jgi:hypothetical protein
MKPTFVHAVRSEVTKPVRRPVSVGLVRRLAERRAGWRWGALYVRAIDCTGHVEAASQAAESFV